jgi:hypothetical protein
MFNVFNDAMYNPKDSASVYIRVLHKKKISSQSNIHI